MEQFQRIIAAYQLYYYWNSVQTIAKDIVNTDLWVMATGADIEVNVFQYKLASLSTPRAIDQFPLLASFMY